MLTTPFRLVLSGMGAVPDSFQLFKPSNMQTSTRVQLSDDQFTTYLILHNLFKAP